MPNLSSPSSSWKQRLFLTKEGDSISWLGSVARHWQEASRALPSKMQGGIILVVCGSS
jgi:hypothetical protein